MSIFAAISEGFEQLKLKELNMNGCDNLDHDAALEIVIKMVTLTKLGLGGWNCGLKTLGCGCEGVDSVNEGVRSAAFDEGVRLAGRLRLGDVACSAASSDSLAAWGCVSLAGVSIATAALAFAQLQKLFLAPGEITWEQGGR